MGFSLKSWIGHATKVPKSIRKINVGKSVRRAVEGGIKNFEATITSAGANTGSAAGDVVAGANAAKQVPVILIVGLAVIAFLIWKKGR